MEDKFAKIKVVLWLILFANLLVATVKIFIGQLINSNSMLADGFHSLTDSSSNIVGLIAIYIAAKPVDEDHPYGHKKFETLAGLFISGMLFFLGIRIVSGAIDRLTNPSVPVVTYESLLALLVTLGINIFISVSELKQGKRLQSDVLISDSYHTRSDIYISLGVLITLIGIKLGLPAIIDPVASLIVSGFIFHAAIEIFLPTCGILADKAVCDHSIIAEVVSGFNEVKDVHEIRSRGRADDVYIDLHIETDPAMSVEDSHNLIHNIEEQIGKKVGGNVQTLIHVEPFYENNKKLVDP